MLKWLILTFVLSKCIFGQSTTSMPMTTEDYFADLTDEPRLTGRVTVSETYGIALALAITETDTTFVFVGPSNYYFAVGFGGTVMDGTYAIVATGDSGEVSDYELGHHTSGTSLNNDFTIDSDTPSGDSRTVIFERTSTVETGYNFDPCGPTQISLIWATSTTSTVLVNHDVARGSGIQIDLSLTGTCTNTDDDSAISNFNGIGVAFSAIIILYFLRFWY